MLPTIFLVMNFHHCAKEKKGGGGGNNINKGLFLQKDLNSLKFQQKNSLYIYYRVQ
jgi:hypothetical protein